MTTNVYKGIHPDCCRQWDDYRKAVADANTTQPTGAWQDIFSILHDSEASFASCMQDNAAPKFRACVQESGCTDKPPLTQWPKLKHNYPCFVKCATPENVFDLKEK